MIEIAEDQDLNLQLIDNIYTTASEYINNLKKEKEALEQKKTDIFDSINSVMASLTTDLAIFENKFELLTEVLTKKKTVLEGKDKKKINFSTTPIEEAKIFKYNTEDYLKLINQIENTKVYLNDIQLLVVQQAPSEFSVESQESHRLTNIPINLTQIQNLSQDILMKFNSHKANENIDKSEKINEQISEEETEVEYSKFISPYYSFIDVQDSYLKGKFQASIIKNNLLSKTIRKNFLDGNYHDFLFNPKYEDLWENISDDAYRAFAKEIRKFAKRQGYDRYILPIIQLEYFLKFLIRVKYTSKHSVDLISPHGGPKSDIIRDTLTKSWIKVKFVLNHDYTNKFLQRFRRINRMFTYYFSKRYGHNTYIVYGKIRSYYHFITYFFYNQAFKDKYDFISVKSFQHEEDLMKNFQEDTGFRHNLEESFIQEWEEKIRELDDIRKEFARIVLNYLVILI